MLDVSPKPLEVLAVSESVAAPDMIREMVLAFRNTGLDRAYEAVARLCDITPRRVRSYWHQEITDPRVSESQRISAGYAAWIAQETRRLDAQRALLTARLDALRSTHEAALEQVHGTFRSVERATVDRRRGSGDPAS
ncbi:MAG TPA: hypothetical protein VNZ61_08835 [Roseomonas sp.]|nr:hypothetical protein [Roseomonas sp.]